MRNNAFSGNSSKYRLCAATGMTPFLWSAIALSAYAQDNTLQYKERDSIVVTATRRETQLQTTPGAVTVLSGQDLEERLATSFDDYLVRTSGVQFDDSGVAQESNITIRGVATGASPAITQQTVGIYIDDIPFTDVFSFLSAPDLTAFDLERVEVLRGPQGALYGSGSMGGAIRYITKKPTTEAFSGRTQSSISFTQEGGVNALGQIALNLPFSDTFAMRGVVSYERDAGYADNLFTGEENDDETRQFHARALFHWKPASALDITGSYIHQDTDSDASSVVEDSTGEDLTFSLGPPFAADFTYELANLSLKYDLSTADLLISSSYAAKRRKTGGDFTPSRVDSLLASFDAALTGLLTPSGAYTPGALLSSNVERGFTRTRPRSDAYFVETRLTSKADRRFRWLIGGLYTRIDNFNPIGQFAPGLNDALAAITVPAPLDATFGADNGAVLLGVPENDQIFDFFQRSKAREYAIYADLELDITDRFTITAGGRYFDFNVDTQLGLDGLELIDIDNDVNAFQPRATLSYTWPSNAYAYFVFSRGYRVGGVNDTIALTLGPGQSIEDSPAPLRYDTDNLFNYELGFRRPFLSGALTANIGVFYIDWSDIQLSSFFPSPNASSFGGVAAISNGGKASIIGVEGGFEWSVTEFLTLRNSFVWNNAELDEPAPPTMNPATGEIVAAPAGLQLPGSRDAQVTTEAVVTTKVRGKPTTLAVLHAYNSSTITDFAAQAPLPSYHLLDVSARISITSAIDLSIFAKNVLDERAIVSSFPESPSGPAAFILTTPRTIGFAVSTTF